MAQPLITAQVNQAKDTATPALKRMLSSVAGSDRRDMLAVCARRLVNTLKEHFSVKERLPNKQGWKKSHFWSQVRSSVGIKSVTNTEATVTISDPRFSIHYYGGTVRPKEAKALAIPLVPEAKGIYPRSGLIPGLFLVRTLKGAFLATKDKGKSMFLKFWFVLVKSATIPKDPTALPPDKTISESLEKEASLFLMRRARA